MLTLDEARARLLTRVAPLPIVEVPLAESLGCRLAESPAAAAELPPADVAAMDGYAVRAADLASGAPLPVAFTVPAGAAPRPLPAGAAARIFTGATLPAGADTVVPQEDAEVHAGGRVTLARLPFGSHVRRRGEIFELGATLGAPGQRVTAARLAALVAGGATRVRIVPRPRVAVLVTGAELGEGAGPAGPGRIRDSNGPMLGALAAESALPVAHRDRVADVLGEIRDRIETAAASADLVVSSGGVSVGDLDLVPRAVADAGGESVFHGVAIQPGKPVLVARLGSAWFVGLPGNPLAVLVGWRMFVRPLAEALAGDREALSESPLRATLVDPARNRGERLQLRPARLDLAGGTLAVRVLAWKGSHDVLGAAPADALVRLDAGTQRAAGESAEFYPLPWRWSA